MKSSPSFSHSVFPLSLSLNWFMKYAMWPSECQSKNESFSKLPTVLYPFFSRLFASCRTPPPTSSLSLPLMLHRIYTGPIVLSCWKSSNQLWIEKAKGKKRERRKSPLGQIAFWRRENRGRRDLCKMATFSQNNCQ